MLLGQTHGRPAHDLRRTRPSELLFPQTSQASPPDTTDESGTPRPPPAPAVLKAGWGWSGGWIAHSPFTRAMFRPLPTLFLTGLMILKRKRKSRCNCQAQVRFTLLRLGGHSAGPRGRGGAGGAEVPGSTQSSGPSALPGNQSGADSPRGLSGHVWARPSAQGRGKVLLGALRC